MSLNALPVSRLVNVEVNLSPLAAQIQNLSTLLIVGNSDVIDIVERARPYATLDEVAADFGTTSPEYLAAVLWFEQAPQPTTLVIGRWAKTDTHGQLLGGALDTANQSMSAWTTITDGAFKVTVDGGSPASVTGLDFHAQTNLNGVASVISTGLTGATCVYNAGLERFEITSTSVGASSAVSFLSAPSSGTDISGQMNCTNSAGDGAYVSNGVAAESALDAVIALDVLNGGTWYAVTVLDANGPATSGTLYGGKLSSADQLVGAWTTVTTGAFKIGVDGATPADITGIDFSAAADLPGVATIISAALSGAKCAWDATNKRFVITSNSTGALSAVSLLAAPATGADIHSMMSGTTALGASSVLGLVADSDHLAIAPYIEGANTKHIYGVTTQEAGTLSSVSTSDTAYQLAQLKYKKTVVQYSSFNPYAVCSLLARILTVDYTGNNTVITLMYKQEPGIVAESIGVGQVAALEAKNCNIFVNYNNDTAIIENGVVSSGDFMDIITGTDWLSLDIQNAVYNLLYTSLTKIPQTNAGVHLILTTIENECSQAVTNGLLAPGVWNSGGFGSLSQGDYLAKGFYAYAPPLSKQNQADREKRKAPTIQVAVKLAGAIHSVDILINVNR